MYGAAYPDSILADFDEDEDDGNVEDNPAKKRLAGKNFVVAQPPNLSTTSSAITSTRLNVAGLPQF